MRRSSKDALAASVPEQVVGLCDSEPSGQLLESSGGKGAKQDGQALVEFAISLLVFCLLLFGVIQLAIIGNAALAVTQLAYAGARYASINKTEDQSAVVSYMQSIAPSTINENSGADLTITVNPSTAPRTYGTPVTVSISYNLQNKLFMPTSFFGVSLPTTLPTIADTMMTE